MCPGGGSQGRGPLAGVWGEQAWGLHSPQNSLNKPDLISVVRYGRGKLLCRGSVPGAYD